MPWEFPGISPPSPPAVRSAHWPARGSTPTPADMPSHVCSPPTDTTIWRQKSDHAWRPVPPDLAVILTADPALIAQRLQQRRLRNRYQHQPDVSAHESTLYLDAARALTSAGAGAAAGDQLLPAGHTRLDDP